MGVKHNHCCSHICIIIVPNKTNVKTGYEQGFYFLCHFLLFFLSHDLQSGMKRSFPVAAVKTQSKEKKKKRRTFQCASLIYSSAASYSPPQFPREYHRLGRSSRLCSGWEQVFPLRHGHETNLSLRDKLLKITSNNPFTKLNFNSGQNLFEYLQKTLVNFQDVFNFSKKK